MLNRFYSGPRIIFFPTASLSLRLSSPDGDEGYPGNVVVTATFSLASNSNSLSICYTATTDAPTVLNLTNHSYFNLSGHGNGTIYDQNLQVIPSAVFIRSLSACLSVRLRASVTLVL